MYQNKIITPDETNLATPLPKSALSSHEIIEINGNEALDLFCSGNGTDGSDWNNAHVIQEYSIIPAHGAGHPISLTNIDRHLILKDLILDSSSIYANVYLSNVSNIWLINVSTTDGTYGLQFSNCNNIIISNCSLADSNVGLSITTSSDVIIENSNFTGTSMIAGSEIFSSSQDIFFQNCLFQVTNTNVGYGIRARSSSGPLSVDNFTISNCTFENLKSYALEIEYGTNITINETFFNNLDAYGLFLKNSAGFLINNNTINTIDDAGIYFRNCQDAIFEDNNFGQNGLYFEDAPLNFTFQGFNTVNNDNIHYYENQNYIHLENLPFAGQIILNNVNHSIIDTVDFSSAVSGIYLFYCTNISIRNSNINEMSRKAIFVSYSNMIQIINCSFIESYIPISISYSQSIEISDNTIKGNNLGYWGIEISYSAQMDLINNTISNFTSQGLRLSYCDSICARNNNFTNAIPNFAQLTEVDIDKSNTINERALYYLYGQFNQTYDSIQMPNIGYLYIQNSQRLIFQNLQVCEIGEYLYIINSSMIEFRNSSFTNLESAFDIYESHDLRFLNSTFMNVSSYAFYFSDSANITIKQCLFQNISSEVIASEKNENLTITENWFYDFDYIGYFEGDSFLNISNNRYGYNQSSDLIELDECISVINETNFESYPMDWNAFPTLVYSDDFLIFVEPDDLPGETNTTTTTSTTPDPENTGLAVWQIVLIVIGAIFGVVIIAAFILTKTGYIEIDEKKKISFKKKQQPN